MKKTSARTESENTFIKKASECGTVSHHKWICQKIIVQHCNECNSVDRHERIHPSDLFCLIPFYLGNTNGASHIVQNRSTMRIDFNKPRIFSLSINKKSGRDVLNVSDGSHCQSIELKNSLRKERRGGYGRVEMRGPQNPSVAIMEGHDGIVSRQTDDNFSITRCVFERNISSAEITSKSC